MNRDTTSVVQKIPEHGKHEAHPSVAVFRIGNIGDTLVALPAFRAIRLSAPNARLVLLTYRFPGTHVISAAAMAIDAGLVDDTVVYETSPSALGRSMEMMRFLFALRRRRFQRLYYLPPPQRNSAQIRRDRLFFRLGGIAHVVGPRQAMECYPRGASGSLAGVEHEAIRLRNIVLPHDDRAAPDEDVLLPVNTAASCSVDACLTGIGSTPVCHCVAIAPGSNMQAKRWPIERFEHVGRILIEQLDVHPIVVGGPDEKALGDKLVAAWGHGVNVAGKFSLLESLECLRRCALYIGNDTGTMHMAAAVGTRCLALFSGRDSPRRWDPYGKGHTVIRKWTSCEGCMAQDCPEPGHPCMRNIQVREVIDAATQMLRE